MCVYCPYCGQWHPLFEDDYWDLETYGSFEMECDYCGMFITVIKDRYGIYTSPYVN